jgi:hypothetical protein
MGAALGLVLLGLLPTAAWAQSPVQSLLEKGEAAGADVELLRTVADRAQKAGLDDATTADLLQPAVTLAERDLPSSPLLTKTLEGLAKQVPAGRMRPVLQQLQAHTQEAGALVSSWLEQPDVQAFTGASGATPAERDRLIANVAEARQQDLPRATLETFFAQLPEAVERRPVPLSDVSTAVSTMPDLPGARDNPEAAQQLLSAALDAGYGAESLRQLPTALEQAQRGSDRPASAIARGARQAIERGTPAARVLRTLSRGGVPGAAGPPPGLGDGATGSPPGQGKPPGKDGRPPGAGPPENSGEGPPADPPNTPPSSGGG